MWLLLKYWKKEVGPFFYQDYSDSYTWLARIQISHGFSPKIGPWKLVPENLSMKICPWKLVPENWSLKIGSQKFVPKKVPKIGPKKGPKNLVPRNRSQKIGPKKWAPPPNNQSQTNSVPPVPSAFQPVPMASLSLCPPVPSAPLSLLAPRPCSPLIPAAPRPCGPLVPVAPSSLRLPCPCGPPVPLSSPPSPRFRHAFNVCMNVKRRI